jgi:hypothetical protein
MLKILNSLFIFIIGKMKIFFNRLPSFIIVVSVIIAVFISFYPLMNALSWGEFRPYIIGMNQVLKLILLACFIFLSVCFLYWQILALIVAAVIFSSQKYNENELKSLIGTSIGAFLFSFKRPMHSMWFGKKIPLIYNVKKKNHSNKYDVWQHESLALTPIYKDWDTFYRILKTDVLPSWIWIIFIVNFSHDVNLWVINSICIAGFFYFRSRLRKIQINRLKEMGLLSLPIASIRTEDLGILVKYTDYVNKKIVDDAPHLEVGQEFDVVLNPSPRSQKEKIQVQIRNSETPNFPALVTEFHYPDLHKAITDAEKNQERFVIKLLEVFPNGKVLLGLKFEKI